MKFISICDPSRYGRPPLDVPTFYQNMALDHRIDFFHLPTGHVLDSSSAVVAEGIAERGASTALSVPVAPVHGELPYQVFIHLAEQATKWMPLEEADLIFCRTLKPFPNHYLEQLQSWEKIVKFVNRPSGVAEQIQADFLASVAGQFTPEMLVTNDANKGLSFFEKHKIIVAKQANSCGGRGVFKIWYQDRYFHTDNLFVGQRSFEQFTQVMTYIAGNSLSLQQSIHEIQPINEIQLVQYLPKVSQGDKRVVVVDGEIYGAYVRRSKSGHWVNNVSGDGECVLAEVTSAEREAIAGTVQAYRDRGLYTLGYDFLMDETGTWRISEINAGNIGGFARLELLTQQPVMARFVQWLIDFARDPHRH